MLFKKNKFYGLRNKNGLIIKFHINNFFLIIIIKKIYFKSFKQKNNINNFNFFPILLYFYH